jgi:RNA polymerase sigma-70 factor (ECF subfamily)
VQGGEFQLPDSEALWRLLCAIVVAKVREQTRFHMRGKRAVQREVAADLEPRDTSTANIVLASPGPTPAEAAEWADQLQQLLQGLTEEERQIVDLKLQQYTHEEVAQHLGRSERTVRRLLKRIEARLLQTLAM